MTRYVQPVPPPADPYTGDPLLRSWLDRQLGTAGHTAAARTGSTALAADVTGPLRAAHADAEAHPPHAGPLRPVGRAGRPDRHLRRLAARSAPPPPGTPSSRCPTCRRRRARWGAGARVVQHALLHLYGPESATFSCPVAMADGAAALLSASRDVDPGVRDAWLPRLISTDPDTPITSGQWMTESQGGSDLARSTTTARPAADGSWRLTGEKWFCSAADAAMAVALARPEGAGAGSRVLAPFLVPRYAADSPLAAARRADAGRRPAPGVTCTGSRTSSAPGRCRPPRSACATRTPCRWATRRSRGLVRAMTLVVVTRLHNAAAAAGGHAPGSGLRAGVRRGPRGRRRPAGRLAAAPGHPGHPRRRRGRRVRAGRARVRAARPGRGRRRPGGGGRAAHGGAAGQAGHRPSSRSPSASEYVECFGGAGYVEDTGVPRLLRDAQVLPIWEGTTNVLALDVLRAVRPRRRRHAGAGPARGRPPTWPAAARPALADTLATAAATLHGAGHRGGRRPGRVDAVAGRRPWAGAAPGVRADRGPAGRAGRLGRRAAPRSRRRLWARRWLRGEDIGVPAHHHLDLLG